MKLIDFDVLKKLVEQRLDMQDLYLPVHFLDVAEELAEMGPWTPFRVLALSEETKKRHPDWVKMYDCELPEDGQKILVTVNATHRDGCESVQQDYWVDNGSECGLDSGWEPESEAVAWMPMPEPYKEAKEND